jgi:L,D-peptidoglycan transpeptidase YkuD (ErfK/YbiS/YcfS/YnhG family)
MFPRPCLHTLVVNSGGRERIPPPAAYHKVVLLLQLVLVVTAGWDAPTGELTRWEQHDGKWRQVGPAVPVAVGYAGLAWGRGLEAPMPGRQKREGDHRSPAGRFAIGQIYDRADGVCVDDPESPDYNRIVAEGRGEPMTMFRRAIFVAHNSPAKKNAGSCIFLHDGNSPTVGCTAMAPDKLDELAAWLRPGAQLVQLPRDEYRKLKAKWKLP